MTTPTAERAVHGTLTANTVSSVVLTSANGMVEVINRTGTDEIYFVVSSSENVAAAPTIGGDDCFVVPAGIMSYVVQVNMGSVGVHLISAGAMEFSVIGGQPA